MSPSKSHRLTLLASANHVGPLLASANHVGPLDYVIHACAGTESTVRVARGARR